MTYSVVLPYREDCGFRIHLEGNPDSGYIHEFRPRPVMQEWLDARSFLSYRTLDLSNSYLEQFTHMEVLFSIEADALLCKLTWG